MYVVLLEWTEGQVIGSNLLTHGSSGLAWHKTILWWLEWPLSYLIRPFWLLCYRWFAHLHFVLGRGAITPPGPAMIRMDRKDLNLKKRISYFRNKKHLHIFPLPYNVWPESWPDLRSLKPKFRDVWFRCRYVLIPQSMNFNVDPLKTVAKAQSQVFWEAESLDVTLGNLTIDDLGLEFSEKVRNECI